MSPLAQRVVRLLAPHTPFAEAIVRRQCERHGFSLATLDETQLPKVAPAICMAASVFVDPPTLRVLRDELGVP